MSVRQMFRDSFATSHKVVKSTDVHIRHDRINHVCVGEDSGNIVAVIIVDVVLVRGPVIAIVLRKALLLQALALQSRNAKDGQKEL